MTLLDTVEFFSTLTLEDKQHLSYFCQEKKVIAGEELFHQWDEPSAFYVVISGTFSVHKMKDGITSELGPVCEGDILGEMSLYGTDTVRNATVTAKEDSLVLTILDFSIKELTNKYPDLLKKIQDIIKQRTQ